MIILSPKIEEKITDYVISKYKNSNSILSFDIDLEEIEFLKQPGTYNWFKVNSEHYLTVLHNILQYIEQTNITEIVFHDLGFCHLFHHLYKKGTAETKEMANRIFEKIFNSPQIESLTIDIYNGQYETFNAFCEKIDPLIRNSKTLKYLKLTSCGNMGIQGVKIIVDALMQNSSCQTLNLECCGLFDEATPHLIRLLNKNQIINIDLKDNNFTDKGIRELFLALLNNKKLKKINLDDEDYETDNAITTPETNMVHLLHFINNSLEITANNQFANEDKNTHLSLLGSNLIVPVNSVLDFNELFRKIGIDDQTAFHIILNVINGMLNQLSETSVEEICLNSLAVKTLCTEIDLKENANQIQNIFNLLFMNSQIKKIIFVDDGVNPNKNLCEKIASYIAQSTSLKKLGIVHSQLTPKDLHALTLSLIQNKSCKELYLGSNHLKDEVIPYLIRLLSTNQLQALNLENNEFSDEAIQKLLKALIYNTSLKKINLMNYGNDKAVISTEKTWELVIMLRNSKNLDIKAQVYTSVHEKLRYSPYLFNSPSQPPNLVMQPNNDSRNNLGFH